MQLQPHFLFNTLNTVAELVHSDPDTADQMITRLGRLLRLSLDHAGHQVVPLRQEIDFLRMYVEIEQVRFQDRLQIVWDVAPDTLDVASGSGECDPTRGHTPGRTRTHRDRLSPRWGRPHSGDPR
jgi:LytS/YehU family sensor histidine kinase